MSIISFIFIYLIHYLLTFFKSTLTVPKVKDLVDIPKQKYQEMYNIINNGETEHLKNHNGNNDENYTLIDLLPNQESNMKNELKSFLKSQLHNDNNNQNKHYKHDNNNDFSVNLDTYDNNHVSYSAFS